MTGADSGSGEQDHPAHLPAATELGAGPGDGVVGFGLGVVLQPWDRRTRELDGVGRILRTQAVRDEEPVERALKRTTC